MQNEESQAEQNGNEKNYNGKQKLQSLLTKRGATHDISDLDLDLDGYQLNPQQEDLDQNIGKLYMQEKDGCSKPADKKIKISKDLFEKQLEINLKENPEGAATSDNSSNDSSSDIIKQSEESILTKVFELMEYQNGNLKEILQNNYIIFDQTTTLKGNLQQFKKMLEKQKNQKSQKIPYDSQGKQENKGDLTQNNSNQLNKDSQLQDLYLEQILQDRGLKEFKYNLIATKRLDKQYQSGENLSFSMVLIDSKNQLMMNNQPFQIKIELKKAVSEYDSISLDSVFQYQDSFMLNGIATVEDLQFSIQNEYSGEPFLMIITLEGASHVANEEKLKIEEVGQKLVVQDEEIQPLIIDHIQILQQENQVCIKENSQVFDDILKD